METRKVPVLCYWNGCIKNGPDGPLYEGSSPRVIRVERKTSLAKLLDDLHRVTGFDKGKFKIDVIGRYPSTVQQPLVKYIRLPVVDDPSLETMLEVPTYHLSINNVEFYLEVTPVSDQGNAPSLASLVKRKRSRQDDDDSDKNEAVQQKNPPNVLLSDCVPKQLLFSSSWLDERELRVGMLFKDKAELVKAVELYSCRRQRKSYACMEFSFSSQVWRTCGQGGSKCKWTLEADKTKKGNGCYEITKYNGPHTCEPVDVRSDFLAAELKGLLKARPSLSVSELNKWVKEEFGYTVSREVMWDAKKQAITAILDESLSVLPKFMASLCSSNKMRLEWRYDRLPDPKDASFRSVFWAFHQSIEGFPYCRPVIIVDAVDCVKQHCGKLLVAAGFDAETRLFPLAFAVVSQEKLSADSWRWFFACIRKKATHREGLCLITAMDPDIVTVVNEAECGWAQHRFCLRHLCFEFYDAFHNNLMTEFVYKAGSTGCISSFDCYLKKIEEMNPEARKWLEKIPPHKWALAHDDGGLRFGIMETNLIFTTYRFLNSIPDLSITTCILLIFDHLAELFISQRGLLSESLNNGDKYAKHVITKLGEYTRRYDDVLPLDNTGERFQVVEVMKNGNNKRFVVHCIDRVCTCGIWQLYKYPCSHLLAVCRTLNIEFLQYVNDYYNTERSLQVYAAKFNHVPGSSEWPEASGTPRLFPPRRSQPT